MSVQIGRLKIRNPVILASGVLGDDPAKLRAAYESGAGAVVTKSITPQPRPARPRPIIIKTDTGWLNAVGLENPGARVFADRIGDPDYPVIVSLAGSSLSDFESMIRLFGNVAGFELNLSCPNVDNFGHDIGDDPRLAGMIVEAITGATDLPVFVKIGHHMTQSAKAAVQAGADGITAINTVPAMSIDPDTCKPVFGSRAGGLSGPPIRLISLRTVNDLADMLDAPIIGCGGVSTWQDAAESLMAGAVAVQVGSAAMDDLGVLGRIADGLAGWDQKTVPLRK